MLNKINFAALRFENSQELALNVLRLVGQQLVDRGLSPSKWWQPENMNAEFFKSYAEPSEFWAALLDGQPIAAQILQWNQRNQDWSFVDKESTQRALYIHWLCVDKTFAGREVPRCMVDFAAKNALEHNVKLIRVDTNASEKKLCNIYESLGFKLRGIQTEGYRVTAFYELGL